MLLEQTLEKLAFLKLHGMTKALRDFLDQPKAKDIAPVDLVGLLVDAEHVAREDRRLKDRLRKAHFKLDACVEDIDYSHPRGLNKQAILELASSRWVQAQQNIILTGPTGVGKSYLACALAQKACRDGYSALYRRASRLFDELMAARADGTYLRLLQRLANTNVLIIDDLGIEPLGAPERKHLYEVLEDRCPVSSTIITSQLDPKDWHPMIGEATIADSINDRLVHNAHRIKLSGESMRKSRKPQKP
jgi:DNA replication protein DnaC